MSQTWLRSTDRNLWDHLHIVKVMFRWQFLLFAFHRSVVLAAAVFPLKLYTLSFIHRFAPFSRKTKLTPVPTLSTDHVFNMAAFHHGIHCIYQHDQKHHCRNCSFQHLWKQMKANLQQLYRLKHLMPAGSYLVTFSWSLLSSICFPVKLFFPLWHLL